MIYRAASWLAGAGLPAFARGDLAARLRPRPAGPAAIWVHGASVGELRSAERLLPQLARIRPLIVTANTQAGLEAAREMGFAAHLAPLDTPQAVGRFLDAARPRVIVTLENELWPNRIRIARARGISQVVIGARISARSARRWRLARGMIAAMLGTIDGLSAQDAGSEARFLALGLPPSAVLPRMQLKLLAPARITPPAPSAARDRTVLAASTHEGEDGPILDAYLAARARIPDLRLIIAPRHPRRAPEIAALLDARGLGFARRSDGAGLAAPVLLGDTLGEMGLWYGAAGICITGGSLTDKGGHTPWEPAAYGCAILHGPHISNFAPDYQALHEAGGACPLGAAPGETLAKLAENPAKAREIGAAARAVLEASAPDPAPLIAAIAALATEGPSTNIDRTGKEKT
ncbi:MAG: glycosyltransferase N-terminal domain-containing protein [Paracoccus sp. (in: a-proteobacteria)]|nr:glycosyltransferase N-terminal domain-containing protein [Paracoccus sp. (in: a-proteobacteria)]